MINYMKNEKNMRFGLTVIFSLFLIILLIILISKPNDEHISSNNNPKISTEQSSTWDMTLSVPEQTTLQKEFSTTENITENNSENITENESTQEETTPEITSPAQNPKDLIDFDAEYPFEIEVNRAENFVVVYGLDKNGQYSIAYKTFWCSTGLNPEDTPLGIFKVSDKYRWRLMVDGTYAQYAMRIHGQIMLHSVPYLDASNDTLESWEYNKLGNPASLGCIRLNAKSIKWIYDNCNPGTTVVVYDNPGEEPPIKLKKLKKIKESNENSGWDPTDPDKNNPWKKKRKE